MGYYDLEDVKGIDDLKELGGTATKGFSFWSGLTIRATDDGDKIYTQYTASDKKDEIEIRDIEYYSYSDEISDILNVSEDEFESHYGGVVAGFEYEGEIYLIAEFLRDNL